MSHELVLSNARVVLEHEVVKGSVVIRDGRIASIDQGSCNVAGVCDMDTDYLIPGLVELHTDNFEAHAFPRPGVNWPTMPALLAHDAAVVSAGITTVFDAIATGEDAGKAYRRALCEKVPPTLGAAAAMDLLRADHMIHLRCEIAVPGMAAQFERMRDDARVHLVSVMDHTPGQRQFVSLDKYREYYMGKYDVKADDMQRMIEERLALQARYADSHRRLVTDWCREQGTTMASHDDATPAHVAQAIADGISIAEFPTTSEAASAARERGMATVVGAPNMVRGGSHSGNIAASDLAEYDLLDAFSSDYVPSSLLDAAWRLHHDLEWPLVRAVSVVSANPASMVGLCDRGRLASGMRADVVRVLPQPHGPVVRQVWRRGRRVL